MVLVCIKQSLVWMVVLIKNLTTKFRWLLIHNGPYVAMKDEIHVNSIHMHVQRNFFCESEISSYISSEVSLYVPENPRKSHIGKTICCYIEIFYKFEITVINS